MNEIFKALSEISRLRILSLLIHGPMCVCEIEDCLKLTQSNTSRHLSTLKGCGLLESYKEAQWTYYRISENFKNDHSKLWDYLTEELDKIESFSANKDLYENCKAKNICLSK